MIEMRVSKYNLPDVDRFIAAFCEYFFRAVIRRFSAGIDYSSDTGRGVLKDIAVDPHRSDRDGEDFECFHCLSP